MNETDAKALILESFPEIDFRKIMRMGEGLGNIAFEVNDELVFRFPKTEKSKVQLEREISCLGLINKYATLPVPNFIYVSRDNSFVGYKKILGTPLLAEYNFFTNWALFSEEIGRFLSVLHSVPRKELVSLNVSTKDISFDEWKSEGRAYFEKVREVIPNKYIRSIENFFTTPFITNTFTPVLSHNDFGIEHIIIDRDKISGIIDWSGAAISDPAGDFGRLYRDLGSRILDQVLLKYTSSSQDRTDLKTRAIFYGKCLAFQDIYYGIEHNQHEYSDKSLTNLEGMFSQEE